MSVRRLRNLGRDYYIVDGVRMTDTERAIQTEHDIWNYPLDESVVVCEEMYEPLWGDTNWTTSNTNILWHYYETIEKYL